ncbi:hypothetical protein EDD40_6129 [Saccharothrix texasensis]|uniref:Uncharacterized protein n=2 Tax=Saccharothrix texasensis TaxID=103734 RepID=A0A3N1HEL1_9PSEU|nr:hypothetical protein EDD40_6129 [Saccharothrix texasensis]
MLSPDTSDERITRGLRWYMKDMRDGYKAVTEVGAPEPPPLQDAKERIKGVADVLGISSSTVHSGYQSTEVVSEAETCLDTQQRSNLLLIWRLCSGFAHGRAWPTMVFATATDKTSDPENPKVIVTKTENTYERVAMLATTAEVALRSAVVLYDKLGTAP